MARVILILSVLGILGCSTARRKDSPIVDIQMRDQIFVSQNNFANLILGNEVLFLGVKKNKCIKNWVLEHKKIKEEIRTSDKEKLPPRLWLKMGTCYAYAKKFKYSVYYYDLALSSGQLNRKLESRIYFNLGMINELRNQKKMAYHYFEKSLSVNRSNKLPILKMAMLELEHNDFRESNSQLERLERYFPQSVLVKFLMGVNYFHLGQKKNVRNKVLKYIDEKSVESILLRMALGSSEKKNAKRIETDLVNLDVEFKIHQDFKSYLLGMLGR